MKFKDKIVWITGASSGLGEALTHAFCKQGAQVIISSRRREQLERVQAQCAAFAGNTHILPLDLANHESLETTVKQVLQQFGHVDYLVHNGGISQRGKVAESHWNIDKKIMDINYFSYVILTKAILPSMLERKTGHFIVMSSLTGKFGTPVRSAYAASKHALHGFFDSLRSEIYQENVKVTIVCPGFIRTNISINALTADGNPQNKMDDAQANGMAPHVFAHKVLKAIIKEKEEVYIGGSEVMGIYLKRFVPALFSKIIRKRKVT